MVVFMGIEPSNTGWVLASQNPSFSELTHQKPEMLVVACRNFRLDHGLGF